MKTLTKVLASSVFFNSGTAPISTSAAASTAQFSIQPGASGGPVATQFATGIAMQALIGSAGNASSSLSGATFSILGSNVLEQSMFQVVATTTVASTGSWLIRDSAPWYKYVDFRFTPAVASTSAVLTVIYNQKGNS